MNADRTLVAASATVAGSLLAPLGVVLLAFSTMALAASDGEAVAAAASRFEPDVRWNARSALALDFTCRGRREFALLGAGSDTKKAMSNTPGSVHNTVVVIAVFTEGIARSPKLLRVPEISPGVAILAAESLNQSPAELRKELGALPSGWRGSRTCQGLNLGDGLTDSFHIYWHATLGGLAVWQL